MMNELSAVKILHKIIDIAEKNNDNDLLKWGHLELEGYYRSNTYLTDDVTVPEYREIPGEYRDEFDRTIEVTDPRLSFINLIRLRNSAIELERLAQSSEQYLSIADIDILSIINKQFNTSAVKFIFSPVSVVGIINLIREEAVRRSRKYISRSALLSTEDQVNKKETYGTASWLWKNLPLTVWFKLIGILFSVFMLGLYMPGITPVRKILRHLPFYKSNLVIGRETADIIEKSISELTVQHNKNIANLQSVLLREEHLSTDLNLPLKVRDMHKEESLKIQKFIEKENDSFNLKINTLKNMLE